MPAPVGAGFGNSKQLLCFNFWLLKKLVKERKSYDCIHAVDLDSILPAYLVAKIFGKKIVYDIFDAYSASRNVSGPIAGLMNATERFIAKTSDFCILPAKARLQQLKLKQKQNIVILENVPVEVDCSEELTECSAESNKVTFSYVGIFERFHRGIEDFLEYFENSSNHSLLIAGYGELAPEIKRISEKHANITYFGEVGHADATRIMQASDAILGFYYLTVPNHEYASPNKYYEHLMLGKAFITTKGTPPGALVNELETGLAIESGQIPMREALEHLTKEELQRFGSNAQSLWERSFRDYYRKVLKPEYLKVVTS